MKHTYLYPVAELLMLDDAEIRTDLISISGLSGLSVMENPLGDDDSGNIADLFR